MSKLLIDGDHIIWKILPNKKQTPEEIEQYGDYSKRTFEDIQKGLDWFIEEKILKPTNADEYIGFLGGHGNFRKQIADSYKANRIGIEYPRYFDYAKEYLIVKWGFVKVNNIESEDAVGICLTQYPDSIIVRVDHDLDQLPGIHFNPNKEEFRTISLQESMYFQWKQMLTGCTSDQVKGIPQVGEVKANKILEQSTSYRSTHNKHIVLDAYTNYFGEYQGVIEFSKNYQLLKILREKEEFVIPEFIKVTKPETTEINQIEF